MTKVFLSWSGEPSQRCAEALHRWLPYFNTAIEPFVSSADIRRGDRGLQRIAEQLEGSSFGIVCVNQANLRAPWINFESGALSRQVREGKVIPFLLGVTVAELVGSPLAQFQAVTATDESHVLEMVKTINQRCEPAASERTINHLFETFWPELSRSLDEIERTAGSGKEEAEVPSRPTETVLNDLLVLIREQVNRITDLERAVGALHSGVKVQDRRGGVPFSDIYDAPANGAIPASPREAGARADDFEAGGQ